MEKIVIGYTNASVSRINKDTIKEFDIKKTNSYLKTRKALDKLGYKDCIIIFDIINSHNRKKPKLYELLENSYTKGVRFDVLMIADISVLGEGEELAETYATIIQQFKKDVLIPDFNSPDGISKYSTVNLNLEQRKDINYREIISELSQTTKSSFKRFRGRLEKKITSAYINAYWLYEKFLIPEPVAYEISGVSKGTFHKLASEYEETEEYLLRLYEEDKKYNIHLKPKRHGAVPKGFVSVIALVDKGVSLESACIQSGIQPINPIDYERYKLKYFGGRKALAKAMEY